jgi:hypothetical protein
MIWFNPDGEIFCFINFPWFINVEVRGDGRFSGAVFGSLVRFHNDEIWGSFLKLEKNFKITNQRRLKKQIVKQFLIGTK